MFTLKVRLGKFLELSKHFAKSYLTRFFDVQALLLIEHNGGAV